MSDFSVQENTTPTNNLPSPPMDDGSLFHTSRLTLRSLTLGDAPTVFAYGGDPDNTKFMMFLPYASMDEVTAELSRMVDKMNRRPKRDFFLAIELDGVHIGEISLEADPTFTEAELGWILRKEYQGHGYMTEAAVAIRDFAFRELGIQRLFARCDSDNKGSSKVMERLGMALSATGSRRNRFSHKISAEYTYVLQAE